MIIIFLGLPGSGKGTIAQKLEVHHGLKQISTGKLFREEIRKGTELGKKTKKIIDAGNLMPDEITNEIVKKYITDNIIFDGYPRTIGQAEALEGFTKVDAVIFFDITEDIIVHRINGRLTCPNDETIYHIDNVPPKVPGKCDKDGADLIRRKDQDPTVLDERFKEYQKKTAPLFEYYKEKGLLKTIDASGTPEEVYNDVVNALGLGK